MALAGMVVGVGVVIVGGGGGSVILHFSFQRLLKLSNHQKPAETWKVGHLEMQVHFSRNLWKLEI